MGDLDECGLGVVVDADADADADAVGEEAEDVDDEMTMWCVERFVPGGRSRRARFAMRKDLDVRRRVSCVRIAFLMLSRFLFLCVRSVGFGWVWKGG